MSIIDDVKSVAKVVQQIDNVELYKKILDLQAQVMDVVEENGELKKENASLRERLEIKQSLNFERNAYWSERADGTKEGPFCTKCWDKEKLLVRMLTMDNRQYHRCPACSKPVNTSGRPEETPDITVITRDDRGF